jgi:hypothetical protein
MTQTRIFALLCVGAGHAELRRFNVVKVVAGGPRQHVLRWLATDSARITGST